MTVKIVSVLRLSTLIVFSAIACACLSMTAGRGDACTGSEECASDQACYRGYCVTDDAHGPDASAISSEAPDTSPDRADAAGISADASGISVDSVESVESAVAAPQLPASSDVESAQVPTVSSDTPAAAPLEMASPSETTPPAEDTSASERAGDAATASNGDSDAGVCVCPAKGPCDKHACEKSDNSTLNNGPKAGEGG